MASVRKTLPSPAADTLSEDTTAPPTPEPAKAEEKAAPVAPEPKPAPAPKAETKAAQPPPPPPAPTTRTYRVWKHGVLQRNGTEYKPGTELTLACAEASKIPCLEPVD